MFHREALWQRVSGAGIWPLAWGLAASAGLPWLIPETWDGHVGPMGYGLVGGLLAGSLPLLAWRRWRWLSAIFGLLVWTLFGLGRIARVERALPVGMATVEGTLDAAWSLQGSRRRSVLGVTSPKTLAGQEWAITLPAEGDPGPPPGTPVRIRAELVPVDPAPAFLAERPLWRARDASGARRIRLNSTLQFEVLGPPRPSLLLRFQTWARRRFEALPLEGAARDLWGALTLGIHPVQDEVTSAFAESGTIHTLVVSGLQVTLVILAVEALWRRSRLRGAGFASAVCGILYAALVGFSAPVWRGLLMGLAWAVGRGTGWRLPPVATLHFALLLWLLAHPAAGCEPGFLLSWFALLGLLWGAEAIAGVLSPLLGPLALPVARLVGPWLATLPLLALFHGGAPLWGVAANLLLLPLVALLTPLCLLLTLAPIPGLVDGIAAVLAWTANSLVPVFRGIVPLATGVLWPWLLLTMAWIVLAHRHARLERTRALVVGILAATGLGLAFRGTGRAPRTLSLESIDVGQGDAHLLRVPGGRATLVDTGGSPWAARRIARVLSRRGVREDVDLVLTHPHGDHAGGWTTLVRLWPLGTPRRPAMAKAGEAWGPFAPGGEAILPAYIRGEGWSNGGAAFSVRWPPAPLALPDANMVSLVLRVRWRDRELWLMGDALGIQERDLLDLGDPGPWAGRRLLKTGHHGSATASDPAWLTALRPDLAILPAARRSDFPSPGVLDRLKGQGIDVHTTGPAFGVRVEAVPAGWKITPGGAGTFR